MSPPPFAGRQAMNYVANLHDYIVKQHHLPLFLQKIYIFLKKIPKKFAQLKKSSYLCTRKSEIDRYLTIRQVGERNAKMLQ
jgi:hypothetical protein